MKMKTDPIKNLAAEMNLRDFFAAGAMRELIARWSKDEWIHETSVAEFAYQMADAMIRQRGS